MAFVGVHILLVEFHSPSCLCSCALAAYWHANIYTSTWYLVMVYGGRYTWDDCLTTAAACCCCLLYLLVYNSNSQMSAMRASVRARLSVSVGQSELLHHKNPYLYRTAAAVSCTFGIRHVVNMPSSTFVASAASPLRALTCETAVRVCSIPGFLRTFPRRRVKLV